MQREMTFFEPLENAEFVPDSIVTGWTSVRDAVIWCWENRKRNSRSEPDDQAMFARNAGFHAPHMSRCVNRRTKAPMDMAQKHWNEFEAFTGWRGLNQYVAKSSGLTLMEQVISERKAA